MAMSLDGFIVGPNVGVKHPMGEGGSRLHRWMGTNDTDAAVIAAVYHSVGGRAGAGALRGRQKPVERHPYPAPSFVLTHEPREDVMVDNWALSLDPPANFE
jgi:hypothetical protein